MQHIHISSEHKLFDLKLKEVWKYRDLVLLFTKRNYFVKFKQTILGPAWLVISPIMTSIVYVILFGNIAKLSTAGVPQLLFYLTSNAIWTYFASCVSDNASIFIDGAGLFGKIYFPRLVCPIANVIGVFLRFLIQFALIIIFWVYYLAKGMISPDFIKLPLIVPAVIQLGLLGLGFGIIISALTTKYRDLKVIVGFCMSLWMYATPVVYTLDTAKETVPLFLLRLIKANPVTAPIELFRSSLLGIGGISWKFILVSWVITVAIFLFGILIFNKVERTFMDTV